MNRGFIRVGARWRYDDNIMNDKPQRIIFPGQQEWFGCDELRNIYISTSLAVA